jgi:hypothetical protein
MTNTKNKTLTGLFSLDHNVRIYIPSTVNVNKKANTAKLIDKGLTKFSGYFGGATSYKAIGAWQSKDAGLVKEKITIVEAYATSEQIEKHIDKVIAFCEFIKKSLKQEAVSLEYDNKLYFI